MHLPNSHIEQFSQFMKGKKIQYLIAQHHANYNVYNGIFEKVGYFHP